jgi:hypothetical protein
MDWFDFLRHGSFLSMIVNNLDIERSRVFPAKTDAPLIVDTDAVLSGPAAAQGVQPIVRRDG